MSQYDNGWQLLQRDFCWEQLGTAADSCLFTPPAAPYATNLSVFAGTVANGPWSLYVADTQAVITARSATAGA